MQTYYAEKKSKILKNHLCTNAAPTWAHSWLFGWTKLNEMTHDFYQFNVIVEEWRSKQLGQNFYVIKAQEAFSGLVIFRIYLCK